MGTTELIGSSMTCESETLSVFVVNIAIAVMLALAVVSVLFAAGAFRIETSKGMAAAGVVLALVLVLGGIAIWTAANVRDGNVYSSTADDICQAYGIDEQSQIRNDIAGTLKRGGGCVKLEDAFVRVPSKSSAYYQLTNVVCDIAIEEHPGSSFLYTQNIAHITMYEKTSEGDFVAMKPAAEE